jgi:hypothetical protein
VWIHVFFIALTLFSFRHVVIPGDHLWTGEGARFSWSMRLKGKNCRFQKKNKNDEWKTIEFSDLTFWQSTNLDDPFLFLSYVQKVLCPTEPEVYAKVSCRSIGRSSNLLIDPAVNLCQVNYQVFGHNAWISGYPGEPDPLFRYFLNRQYTRSLQ